jgi:hypothetical protein
LRSPDQKVANKTHQMVAFPNGGLAPDEFGAQGRFAIKPLAEARSRISLQVGRCEIKWCEMVMPTTTIDFEVRLRCASSTLITTPQHLWTSVS